MEKFTKTSFIIGICAILWSAIGTAVLYAQIPLKYSPAVRSVTAQPQRLAQWTTKSKPVKTYHPQATVPTFRKPVSTFRPQATIPTSRYPVSTFSPQATIPTSRYPVSTFSPQATVPTTRYPVSAYRPQATVPTTRYPASVYRSQATAPTIRKPVSTYRPQSTLPMIHPPMSAYKPTKAKPPRVIIPSYVGTTQTSAPVLSNVGTVIKTNPGYIPYPAAERTPLGVSDMPARIDTGRLGQGDARSPITRIRVIETLDGPGIRNPGDYELPPEGELGQETPLPEGVDPGKLPGWGCPDRGLPEAKPGGTVGDREDQYDDYDRMNDRSNVACDASRISDDALIKRQYWNGYDGDDYDDNWDPNDEVCEGSGDDQDEGDGDVEDDAQYDYDFTEEEEVDYDFANDPDPEGDDPEELRGESFNHGMAQLGQSGVSGSGGNNGMPTRNTGERGQGIGWRVKQEARPGVEDGGPDELGSPVQSGAINSALLAGQNASPTPDDPNPTPPRPEFGQGELRARASGSATSDGNVGGQNTCPPPDDGGGDGPVLPPTA